MIKKGFIYLVLFMLAINVAYALYASISNPKVVLYRNITEGETIGVDYKIIINNPNDFDVSIRLEASGDWTNVTEFEEDEFTIPAGNRTEAKYTVAIEKEGYYKGDIIAYFNNADEPSDATAALAQIFEVAVKKLEEEVEDTIEAPEPTQIAETPEPTQIAETAEPTQIAEQPKETVEAKTTEPSNLVGVLIILVMLIIGIIVYYLIVRGGKK